MKLIFSKKCYRSIQFSPTIAYLCTISSIVRRNCFSGTFFLICFQFHIVSLFNSKQQAANKYFMRSLKSVRLYSAYLIEFKWNLIRRLPLALLVFSLDVLSYVKSQLGSFFSRISLFVSYQLLINHTGRLIRP